MSAESVVVKLKAKISHHEAEAKRLRGLLDALLREVGDDTPTAAPSNRLKGMNFPAAAKILLRENGPMTAAQLTEALLAGGFETKSDQPKRLVASLLIQQEQQGVVTKSGDRASGGVFWSLKG